MEKANELREVTMRFYPIGQKRDNAWKTMERLDKMLKGLGFHEMRYNLFEDRGDSGSDEAYFRPGDDEFSYMFAIRWIKQILRNPSMYGISDPKSHNNRSNLRIILLQKDMPFLKRVEDELKSLSLKPFEYDNDTLVYDK